MKWTKRLEGFIDTCEVLIWIGGFIMAFIAVFLWAEVGFLAFLICAVLIVAGVVFGLLALSLAGTVVEISENTHNTYTRMMSDKILDSGESRKNTMVMSDKNTVTIESRQKVMDYMVSNGLLDSEKNVPVSYVCDKCGAHYVKGSYFCEKCGNKL